MSVIQKIRTKYAKLAGGVIALSLIGFILMDAASGRFGDFLGRDNAVAKVNGNKIDIKDYSLKVKDYEILYNYSTKGRPMDDATRAQLDQQALTDLINMQLVNDECEKLGITTTKEEEKDLIYGSIPDGMVQQYPMFQDQNTHQFNPQYVKAFEQQADQIDPTGKMREEWETLKRYIIQNNNLRKFNALFGKAVFAPKFMMDYAQKQRDEYAGVKFVKVPFNTIDDKTVPVSDEDMVAYMKKHEKMYTTDEETRNIEYVSFDLLPSAEDTARSLGALERLKSEFQNTLDVESMVNRNSDEQYKGAFVNKKSMMSFYADSILSLPAGSVFGPYFENGSYKLTKVIEKKQLPDSVKCRHILIRTEDRGQEVAADTVAKAKIDSVETAIKNGADFKEMVAKYSEDEGSKNTAGEYTFTLQQRDGLSKEFADFIFDGKKGEIKVVKVKNDAYSGYHLIEILDQTGFETAAKLATISKELEAGDNTQSAIYAKASEFAGKYNSGKAFDDATKKGSYNKRVAENIKVNDFSIPGLGNSREMIRWVYESKEGDVSQVFSLNQRYIVAKLTTVQKPGLMKLDENIKPQIENIVRGEKKTKMIIDKYKSTGTLEAIGSASAQQVNDVDSFNWANSYVNHIGYAPKLVGYIFSKDAKMNTLCPPFQGQDGVYYISIKYKFEKPAPQVIPEQMQAQQMSMAMMLRNSLGLYTETLKKAAKITYSVKNL